jgi:branched-chain amino acid transport system permease protein
MAAVTARSRLPLVAGVLLLVLGFAAPFVLAPFYVFQLTMLFSYAVALIGLNLLTGHGGQISLGHAAFYAAGAYIGALVGRAVDSGGQGYLLALPAAGIGCFVFGYLFGVPALRLRGLTLALGTMALSVAVPPLLKRFESVTGGSVGLSVDTPQPPAGIGVAKDQWVYLLTLVVLIAGLLFSHNLIRGRVGRALNAVRDNEVAAEAMGVRLRHYKTMSFALAATYGGIGGVIYTWTTGYVSPGTFGLMLSVYFLAAVIVGGVGRGLGPFIGAAFIYFVPSALGRINDAAPGVTFGVALVAVILVFPSGIGGLLAKLTTRSRRNRKERGEAPDVPELGLVSARNGG